MEIQSQSSPWSVSLDQWALWCWSSSFVVGCYWCPVLRRRPENHWVIFSFFTENICWQNKIYWLLEKQSPKESVIESYSPMMVRCCSLLCGSAPSSLWAFILASSLWKESICSLLYINLIHYLFNFQWYSAFFIFAGLSFCPGRVEFWSPLGTCRAFIFTTNGVTV